MSHFTICDMHDPLFALQQRLPNRSRHFEFSVRFDVGRRLPKEIRSVVGQIPIELHKWNFFEQALGEPRRRSAMLDGESHTGVAKREPRRNQLRCGKLRLRRTNS